MRRKPWIDIASPAMEDCPPDSPDDPILCPECGDEECPDCTICGNSGYIPRWHAEKLQRERDDELHELMDDN